MKRYDLNKCKVEVVRKITVTFNDLQDATKEKVYTIYAGDLISFLYTKNMEDVGKNDKIVRGRVIGISQRSKFNLRQITPYQTEAAYTDITSIYLNKDEQKDIDLDQVVLVIDESTRYETIINKYSLAGILDINPVDYDYPEDNPTAIDTSQGMTVTNITDKDTVYETKETQEV